jgi:sec-independent protein translocase protein TatA
MSSVGLPELLLLAVVALLFFGPKRLPEMARGLGHGIKEFKDSVGGAHDDPASMMLAAPVSPEPQATPETPESTELHAS